MKPVLLKQLARSISGDAGSHEDQFLLNRQLWATTDSRPRGPGVWLWGVSNHRTLPGPRGHTTPLLANSNAECADSCGLQV